MIRSLITISILLLSLSGCIIYVEGANHAPLQHKQVIKQINAQDLNSLTANVGAGQLTIHGIKEQKNIIVTANIYYHDSIPTIFTLEHHDKNAILKANFEERSHIQPTPYIDLTISIPSHLPLIINDGSGAINITNMEANIQLTDGSGHINILGGHHLTINDGSGSIDIKNNLGNIMITDGSGTMTINHSAGDLIIDDGSGDINLQHIAGNIKINDGSGDINVNKTQGTVTLNDGSGDININNTQGLTILAAGSGEVDIDNIHGSIKM
ncbi:DUF4097 family beta strand repeat-containing protein [uncultured Shewanella sp.]|uniref:DUF4097 family beta strand repeat-containing protein n=1 Tax=uncultured Shewanella sp. TaxID=173975 RepID=UPI002603346C|nr:DUF4097 family beta strand repeat-containing protein [uncultured Shewanella sp.]